MDLPPRLSDQQKFALAWLVEQEQQEWDDRREFASDPPAWVKPGSSTHSRALQRRSGTPALSTRSLSWAIAREFNTGHKDRIFDTKEAVYEFADESDGMGMGVRTFQRLIFSHHDQDELLTGSHRASVSRALARLEDRGLVDRVETRYSTERGESTRHWTVCLTDEGRDVGEEILRRHRDGRYSLHLRTLREED